MSKWILMTNGLPKEVDCKEDIPGHEELYGYVYRITHIPTGKIYIGMKAFEHSRRTRISKTEKKKTNTKKVFKKVTKDSKWLSYWGSCKELKEEVKTQGEKNFRREIIELACNKKYLKFAELEHQIKNDVLRTNSYNGNVMGRWFRKDMLNCKELTL